MYSGIAIRDDDVWQGHPDVALFMDRIYIVYRQSEMHLTSGPTEIRVIKGKVVDDNGSRSWFGYVSDPQVVASSLRRLNCPRL